MRNLITTSLIFLTLLTTVILMVLTNAVFTSNNVELQSWQVEAREKRKQYEIKTKCKEKYFNIW